MKRIFGAVIGVAVMCGGAYLIADRIAQQKAEEGVREVQAALPAGSSLEYARIDASPLSGSATLETAVIQAGGRKFRAESLTIGDVAEGSDASLVRIGSLSARNVEASRGDGPQLRATTLDLTDVLLTPADGQIRAMGSGESEALTISDGTGRVHLDDVAVTDWKKLQLSRLRAGKISFESGSDESGQREVFQDVRLEGLDLRGNDLTRQGPLTGQDLLRLSRNARYERLRIGTASIAADGQEVARVEDLEARQTITETGDAVWMTDVGAYALRAGDKVAFDHAVVGGDGMVRGTMSGRQVYDPDAGTLLLENLKLQVDNGGELSGKLRVSGIASGTNENAATLPQPSEMQRARLDDLSMRYADAGLLALGLDALAGQAGTSREALIERYAAILKKRAQSASEATRTSLNALEAFVTEGGTLNLSVKLEKPVPFSELALAFMMRPVRTAEFINLDLQHE